MPKQSPIPDALTKPFWDACNEEKLAFQNCKACNWLQFPPEATCSQCGSSDSLEWKELSGRGKIHGYAVMHDCRVRTMQADQPFNIALIEIEEDPEILMYSNLPGIPADQVPVGADVRVIFETTPATGQKVPEWQVVN
jgi:uncharacterized OB-fold protein